MPYTNPIITGFYPDPSICRVDDNDYYLVTSSFEYFPGVPIFHSHDLVHWRQIGHCLTRASQLPLEKTRSSGGIYAPTIRHHNGMFYMVTTNVSVGKHFYVFTENPAGEWSEPIWIEQGGIDPSLLFDDDGKVYFTWTNLGGILQCELDITTGQCLTEPRMIWAGTGGRYPEAPHLYTINGVYYLLIAEGGTEYGHMVTLARSATPFGPFEPCPHNPILTHRNRGAHVIQATGHGDIVQAHDTSWWMVFLAFRQVEQYRQYHHLGRETYLTPVRWTNDGWIVVNENGIVESEMETASLPEHQWEAEAVRDDFALPTLNLCWNFLRNPYDKDWSLTERPGWLRLKGSAITLNDTDSPAFIGRRQQNFQCRVATGLNFAPQQAGDEAGLTVLMNEAHHYEIAVTLDGEERCVMVRRHIGDLSAIVAQEKIPAGLIHLQIQADKLHYTFMYAQDGQPPRTLATGATRYLSSEVAGGFTGVYFGLYATGNGRAAATPADFDWFDYEPL
jgi:xylan 1,4-beta-xylosidase